MHNIRIGMVDDLCRTCMNSNDDNGNEGSKGRSISIFNKAENTDSKTIIELLLLTAPHLSIDSDDMLPKNVCESCLERLMIAYNFQKMCVKAEKKLQEMIKREISMTSHIDKDPLGDICVSKVMLDSSNEAALTFKVGRNENFMDKDDTILRNKIINSDTETVNNQWEEIDDGNNNSDSESQFPSSNAKIKNVIREIDGTALNEERNCKVSYATQNPKDIGNVTDGSKNFECDECGKQLMTKKGWRQHKLIHSRPVVKDRKRSLAKKNFECGFCKKAFSISRSLEVHIRKHTGENPYLCTECGKTLRCWASFNDHLRRHSKEKLFVCPECPKRFSCSTDLSAHKAFHNKIKPHVCDICGAAFVKSHTLKTHKKYHSGEKKHKCDYCDMRFVLADSCRRHMRTHTGEKPYKCKYCERAFAQSNDLIKHLRSHLGDNVYRCELCPERFRLLGDLRVHFYAHKNDDEETRTRNLQALGDEEHRLQVKFGLIKYT